MIYYTGKLSILPACCNLPTTCKKLVNFIKLQQVCQSQAFCNLSFADLLELVETTGSKPVENKFAQSTCNKSFDNLQQSGRQKVVVSHANATLYRLVVTSCCRTSTNLFATCAFLAAYEISAKCDRNRLRDMQQVP